MNIIFIELEQHNFVSGLLKKNKYHLCVFTKNKFFKIRYV